MSAISDDFFKADVESLLEAIYENYHHDFRQYAPISIMRRITRAIQSLQLNGVRDLQRYMLGSQRRFDEILGYLTVPVSSMFRDSAYFLMLRREIMPILKTYASPKIWVAGCSTGEEAYSLAILLQEEGLLDHSIIYATDINPEALEHAARGIFSTTHLRSYIDNYHKSDGRLEFSNYYHAAYDNFVVNSRLRKRITFSEHSLATDSAFAEVNFISCRNTLIYFNRALQNRAIAMFHESLGRKGFLGLGSKETVEFSALSTNFDIFDKPAKIFRKNEVSASFNKEDCGNTVLN